MITSVYVVLTYDHKCFFSNRKVLKVTVGDATGLPEGAPIAEQATPGEIESTIYVSKPSRLL